MKNTSQIFDFQIQKKWQLSLDAQIVSYFAFTFLCVLNVIELVLDKKFSFSSDWHICILPFVAILIFTVFKRLLFARIKKQKQIFLLANDLLFSGLVLLYIYASFSSLMARDPGKYTTMAQGIKISCTLIAMRHILYNWFFVPLLFFFQFIIYASIAVQLNIEVDVSAIISHLSGIVILLFENIQEERIKRRILRNWNQEEEKGNFWKNALYSGEQGIITFELNGDIIDMNPNFFSLMNISSKTSASNVKNLKTSFQFCMDESNRYGTFKSVAERILSLATPMKPILTFHLKVLCDDNDQKIYDARVELINLANSKFCYMKVFDMTSNYLITLLNNNNFMMEDNPSIEFMDEKSPGLCSTKSTMKCKEKVIPKSLYGIKFFRSIIDDLIGVNQIQFNPCSILKTIQMAINSIEVPDEKAKFKVDLDLPAKDWDFVITSDHPRVKQILVHLLKFAFELSIQSKLTIRVSSDSVNQNFLIEIMPSEEIKNPSRVKQSYDKEYITERLGLAICNALADTICPREKSMRGVKFESREEKGFRLYFWIAHQSTEENLISIADENLYEENEDEVNDLSSCGFNGNSNRRLKPSDIIISIPSASTKFFMKPLKALTKESEEAKKATIVQMCRCANLLVVDDFKPILRGVVQQLRKHVNPVDWVDNYNQALRMVKDRISNPCCYLCTGYKAIFLHFSLSNGKGFEFYRDLRKMILKYNCHQPIVVAYDEDNKYSFSANEAGVDHFFTWPTSDILLKEILQNLQLL